MMNWQYMCITCCKDGEANACGAHRIFLGIIHVNVLVEPPILVPIGQYVEGQPSYNMDLYEYAHLIVLRYQLGSRVANGIMYVE